MFVLLNRNIEQQRGCTYRNGTLMIKGALLGGSRGACAPLLFCSPRGIHTYKKKNVHAYYFPEIPRLVHPCYLGRLGAPADDAPRVSTL